MVSSESMVYEEASAEAVGFFLKEGFCHLRNGDVDFLSSVDDCFEYYKASSLNSNSAFRNAAGVPRHIIDVFRDQQSPARKLFRSAFLVAVIESFYPGRACLIFTHSKLSFKTPGAEVNWFPHQDNGYKGATDLRVGFAVFVCLEDMDERNGCLEVYPGSQKLGTLPHDRVIEDRSTGDNQLRVRALPAGLTCLPICARKGDVVIFSSNTIHQSGTSIGPSRRLALIAEVEEYSSRKLDDYGRPPIVARGGYSGVDKALMQATSLLSPYTIWGLVKKSRRLALLVRKFRY